MGKFLFSGNCAQFVNAAVVVDVVDVVAAPVIIASAAKFDFQAEAGINPVTA